VRAAECAGKYITCTRSLAVYATPRQAATTIAAAVCSGDNVWINIHIDIQIHREIDTAEENY